MGDASQVDLKGQDTRSWNLRIFRRGGVELTGDSPVSLTPIAQSIVNGVDPKVKHTTNISLGQDQ